MLFLQPQRFGGYASAAFLGKVGGVPSCKPPTCLKINVMFERWIFGRISLKTLIYCTCLFLEPPNRLYRASLGFLIRTAQSLVCRHSWINSYINKNTTIKVLVYYFKPARDWISSRTDPLGPMNLPYHQCASHTLPVQSDASYIKVCTKKTGIPGCHLGP